MVDLRIHDFPDELQRQAKSEANLDGEYLRDFAIEAFRREVDRRRKKRQAKEREAQ
jgi:hypothetical protein